MNVLPVWVCATWRLVFGGVQRRVPDPPELELQMVLSRRVGAEN